MMKIRGVAIHWRCHLAFSGKKRAMLYYGNFLGAIDYRIRINAAMLLSIYLGNG
ncbi:hypothetical protein ACQZ40_12075 [Agrobacterium sp. 16-172Ci]|uniref:hypothetical protein n=1 Tax=Agrobacterium deltaense TaxID=1183412 RepID=UPI003D972FE8